MADILVPIGNSLFSPDQLKKVLNDTIPNVPEGHTGAIAAVVDADGAKVGLVVSTKDGHWRVRGVVQHDWSGDNKMAGDVMFSW